MLIDVTSIRALTDRGSRDGAELHAVFPRIHYRTFSSYEARGGGRTHTREAGGLLLYRLSFSRKAGEVPRLAGTTQLVMAQTPVRTLPSPHTYSPLVAVLATARTRCPASRLSGGLSTIVAPGASPPVTSTQLP